MRCWNWASASWASSCCPCLPLIGKFYIGAATQGLWGHLLRGMVCAFCLFPPTVLMGATLPAIARWTTSTPRGVSWLGFFYGGNIVGAVCGCFVRRVLPPAPLRRGHSDLCGSRVEHRRSTHRIWLGAPRRIRRIGDPHAQFVDRKRMARLCRHRHVRRVCPRRAGNLDAAAGPDDGRDRVCVFDHLGRLSDRAGAGSSAGAYLSQGKFNPKIALGWCQLLLVGAIAWAAYALSQLLPYWTPGGTVAVRFQLDLLRCFVAIFPGNSAVGHEFSAGPCSGEYARPRSGRARRQRVRGQYRGRHCGGARF